MKAARSIFTKLFITMIVAGLVVNLLVAAFFRYFFMPRNKETLINNIKVYTDYIVKDIDIPPDTKRAAAIAAQTGFAIAIDGGGLSWSSTAVPPVNTRLHEIHRLPDGNIWWERGRFLYRKEYGPYRYLFSTRHNLPAEAEELHIVLLITVLTVILGLSFLLIRKILMPVRRLTSGMKEVSGGNLDYEVTVKSGDELGELARSFNEMRERIRDMLRSREQLLLDVSHELRSPLTRIKVALEYLEDSGTRRTIAEDVIEVEKMVTEILETERLDRDGSALRKEEVELLQLLQEVSEEMEIPSGEIVFNHADAVTAHADRRLLKMLFRNLLENARKYSEPGNRPITVTLQNDGHRSTVEVRDYGIGITPEDLPRIFEPFYRVDRSRSRKTGGYGLGLSLCKKIVEAHGGSIKIESTQGQGTVVRVMFA